MSNFNHGDSNNQFEKKEDSDSELKYMGTNLVSWKK